MDAITVDGLQKRYGKDIQALDGMTFTVPEGQVFGSLGPNGAGKSTTVRVLVTLTVADGGRAAVAGHDVVRDPTSVRRSLGYVPQASGVDREATGLENLMLQGRLQGMTGAALEQRARAARSVQPRRKSGVCADCSGRLSRRPHENLVHVDVRRLREREQHRACDVLGLERLVERDLLEERCVHRAGCDHRDAHLLLSSWRAFSPIACTACFVAE